MLNVGGCFLCSWHKTVKLAVSETKFDKKRSGLKSSTQRVVLISMEPLHQQDMFGSFLRYVLRHQPLNLLLVVPLLPVILAGLAINGRAARWPMSLLWASTFGRSERRLKRLEPILSAGFASA